VPAQSLDVAPVTLRRSPGAAVAAHRDSDLLAWRRRRGEVDETLRGDRGTHPLRDET
jgi:hypothetical protein